MSLQIMSSREVHQSVLAGRVDFGLMADELPVTGMESSSFMSMPGVVVMPSGHPLCVAKVVEPTELAKYPFIALNPEDASRARLEKSAATFRRHVEPAHRNAICKLGVRTGAQRRWHRFLQIPWWHWTTSTAD